jgi:hypothetical protein
VFEQRGAGRRTLHFRKEPEIYQSAVNCCKLLQTVGLPLVLQQTGNISVPHLELKIGTGESTLIEYQIRNAPFADLLNN